MKKIIFLYIVFVFYSPAIAQSDNWASISYIYSAGPVSPEYQYNYTINIDRAGTGTLTYTKASVSNTYDFSFGKKGMKKLNNALKNSQVFAVSPADMKADQNMIGGPSKSLSITMWQEPNLDQKPTVIQIPEQINDTYSAGINELYIVIEKLVPMSVWNQATGQ